MKALKRGKKILSLILALTLLFTIAAQAGVVASAETGSTAAVSDIKRDGPDETPWEAQWIWGSDNTSMHNWLCMRKTFTMDEVPESVVARIAIDSRYWLWVNGEIVIRDGQLKRGPTQDDTYFEKVEIAPYLKAGENTIAVMGWYFGNDSDYYSYNSSGQGAFVMEADLGNGNLLKTDNTWKVKKDEAFLNRQALTGQSPSYRIPEEHHYYDARKAVDLEGWEQPGFDDSSWENATVYGNVGDAPWNDLWERSIPQMKYWDMTHYDNEGLYDAYKETATTGTVRLKMTVPYNMQLQPYLKVDAPAGVEIEMLSDGTESLNTYYITKEGVQEFEGWSWMSTQSITYVIPAGVKILDLQYRQSGYDAEFSGSFQSEDEFFNQLWEESLYTLYITMRDNYMDCPDRERAQWWGDSTNESHMTFYALDPSARLLYRAGVDRMINWRYTDEASSGDRYNVLQTVVPINTGYFELPFQQLAGVIGLWTYYLYTGEYDFLEEAYQPAVDYLARWNMAENGLVQHRSGSWDWPDWGGNFDVPAMENAWYYWASECVLKMADALGETKDNGFLNERMASIRANYDANFWDGTAYHTTTDVYSTNGYSGFGRPAEPDDRANALAVMSGLATPEKYESIMTNVLATRMESCPYMEKYVLDAIYKMGYDEEALTRMKTRYASMMNDEWTTLWELFGNGGTHNHAWSGGPLINLSANVGGVAPDTPGYDQYHVIPQLGTLNQVSVSVPSIKGDIKVDINRDQEAQTYEMSLVSPENTVARVAVPRFEMENTRVYANNTVIFEDGKATGAVDGVVYDSDDADYIYFLVQPGTWSFGADIKTPATAEEYSVSIDATAGGYVTLDGERITTPYTATYAAGTQITLEAICDEDMNFGGWSGSYGISSRKTTIEVKDNLTLKATFDENAIPTYTFLKISNPSGTDLSMKINGREYSVPCSAAIEEGDPVTIEAVDGTYWDFVNFEGDYFSAERTLTFDMDQDISLSVQGAYKGSALGNMSLGAAVSVENEYVGGTQWRASNLTDGVKLNDGGCTTMHWSASDLTDGLLPKPMNIVIDLGKNKTFDTFKIYPRGNYTANGDAVNFMVDYTLSVKGENDADYHEIYSKVGQENPKNQPVIIDFDTETARYVKVTVTRLGEPLIEGSLGLVHRLQLSELEVYNTKSVITEGTVNIKGEGQVKVNGEIQDLPFSAKYPVNTFLTVEPYAAKNYKFAGWSGDVKVNDVPLYLKVESDMDINAVYRFAGQEQLVVSENLALGKKVTVSNQLNAGAAWDAKNLTDGNTLTGQGGVNGYSSDILGTTTPADKPTIEVDFGSNIDFNSITLYPRNDVTTDDGKSANFPVSFDIQVKLNEENVWRTVSTVTDAENPMGQQAEFIFPLQNARYVRIVVSKVSDHTNDELHNRIQLTEVEAHVNPQTPVNLALGGKVSSNDSLMETDSWSCANLIDGILRSTGRNLATGKKGFTSKNYASPEITNPIWVNVQLPETKTFNQVILYPRSDIDAIAKDTGITPNFPTKYDIQVKNAAGTYETVASVDYGSAEYNINSAPQVISFDDVTSSDVRLMVYRLGQPTWDEQTGAAGAYRLQLCEFQVGYVPPADSEPEDVKEGAIEIVPNGSTTITSLEQTLGFTANVTDSDLKDNGIIWSIENEDGTVSDIADLVGTVDLNTVLLPKKEGSAYVVARMTNGLNTMAKIPFTISLSAPIETDLHAEDAVTGETASVFDVQENFVVSATVADDVTNVRLVNEYGMNMGRKDMTVTDNGDGTKTFRFVTNIGTVGNGRTLSLFAKTADSDYADTGLDLVVDIMPVKASLISASFDAASVAVNCPATLTVVTDTNIAKIGLYNEYGAKMGTLSSSYQDVDGQRIWTITTKIGTAGTRTLTIQGKDRYGVEAANSLTADLTVTWF